MSSYSASAATRRGSVVPPLAGVEKPLDAAPDSCDVLIQGTGLVESILAAALAWQGTNVLHIDEKNYYGGVNAVLNVEELRGWVDSVNAETSPSVFSKAQLYMPRPLESRKYLVDLTPKIVFAKSDILTLLIKGRVSQYLEFKQLGSFHTYENDSFEKVPGSKEDIFTDQSLSLLTKRSLMRFMKFVLDWENHHDVWAEYSSRPLIDFLTEKFKLGDQQIKELVYSIGLCSADKDLVTPRGLSRIKRYLVSLDVYGNFPALFSMYGSAGELAQGFCRSAAVAGATYKLDTAVADFDETNKVAILSDGSRVQVGEKLVRPPRVPTPSSSSSLSVTRMVTIVAKDCKEWFAENECAAVVVFPPGTLKSNKYPVQAIVLGSGSGQCPDGQAVWYLSTIEQGDQARKDLEEALLKLETSILRESTEDFEFDGVDDNDVSYRPDGMPVLSSVKLGQSLQNFVPKQKLQYLLKLSFLQIVEDHDMVQPRHETDTKQPNISALLDSHHVLSEISYDGIVTQAKDLYAKIVGSDEDFFDVDFEDEEAEVERPRDTNEREHEEFGDDMDL
jgi:Rab proteins geranylgeranyltransferase component A